MVYNSVSTYSDKMYLNLHENHLSYITNFKNFAKKFQCEKLFKREWSLKRHHSSCFHRTNYSFPGGFHKTPATIFEKIRSLNINVEKNICYFRKFIVWDMEAILIKNHDKSSDKLQWLSKHKPISVSIASNVLDYEVPYCLVNESADDLISQMMEYINEISRVNQDRMEEKYQHIFDQLNDLIEYYSNDESHQLSMKSHKSKIMSHFRNSILSIKKQLQQYIAQIPVIGFNSGKYDLNLIKKEIIAYLYQSYNQSDIHTIKKENTYLSISTPNMRMLDISNYLAPGCSYAQF